MLSEWQDISTAPKDREIDVWVRCFTFGPAGQIESKDIGRYVNVMWGKQREIYTSPYELREGDEEGWLHQDGLHSLLIETGGYRVTHWMPLPEPPPC